jgi:hypothetical protein
MAFLKKYWWVLAIAIVVFYLWNNGTIGTVTTPASSS